jgi:hypothetical protein
MVGRPNFPPDADERTDLHGMANPTPGLTPLDEEREASMADEGGVSGALMETEAWDAVTRRALTPATRRALLGVGIVLGAGAAFALVWLALRQQR